MNSEDQFETVVREHYEPLFRFAIHLTQAEGDAKDLTQQTFYVWATKGHQLRDTAKAKAWLFTTLRNVFLKERRKLSRFTFEDWETAAEEQPGFRSDSGDSGDFADVRSALTRVDDIYRRAVSLFYLQGCSYLEIVSILSVPLGTVKSRVARGIAQLRKIMLPGEPAVPSRRHVQEESASAPAPERTAAALDAILTLPLRDDPWVAGVLGYGCPEVARSSSHLPGTTSRLEDHDFATAAFDGAPKSKNLKEESYATDKR